MKKRCGGGLIVALILLLGAAFSVCASWPRKQPLRPLVILSERIIYEFKNGGPDPKWNAWKAAYLSPEGRYLIIICREEMPSGPYQGPWFLHDIRTRQLTKLPLPLDHGPALEGPNPFTPDGKYIHVVEPHVDGQASDRPWVLLYDITNRSVRTIKVGPARSVVSDERAENLLVSTRDENVSISIANGVVTKLPFEGELSATFGKDRAIVQESDASELSVVDVVRGVATRKLQLQGTLNYGTPFQTADGRFLCYNDYSEVRDYLASAQNFVASLLPFLPSSQCEELRTLDLVSCWDSARDRLVTLQDAKALAAGPTPSSVWIERHHPDDSYGTWRLLDLATGAECSLEKHGGIDFDCASGNHLVYQVRDKDGGVKIMMIEVALPEPAR